MQSAAAEAPAKKPVGEATLGRIFNVMGQAPTLAEQSGACDGIG